MTLDRDNVVEPIRIVDTLIFGDDGVTVRLHVGTIMGITSNDDFVTISTIDDQVYTFPIRNTYGQINFTNGATATDFKNHLLTLITQ